MGNPTVGGPTEPERTRPPGTCLCSFPPWCPQSAWHFQHNKETFGHIEDSLILKTAWWLFFGKNFFLKKGDEKKKTQPCSSCLHSAWGNISIHLKVSGLFLAVSCPFFKKWHSSCDASCPLFVRRAVLKSECMFNMSLKHSSVNVQPELQILDRGYPSHDQNMISRIINDSHAVKVTDIIPWGKLVHKTKSQVSFHHCLKFNITPGCCGG